MLIRDGDIEDLSLQGSFRRFPGRRQAEASPLADQHRVHRLVNMHLHTFEATLPLSESVERIWDEHRPARAHDLERILPDGSVLLGINLLNAPIILHDLSMKSSWSLRGAFVCGPHSNARLLATAREHWLLAVQFKPGCARRFLGVPLNELRNDCVPLEVFWGSRADELYERILSAADSLTRWTRLEESLRDAARYESRSSTALGKVLAALQHPAPPPISELRQQVGMTATRFIHLFAREVGVTPKRFARLQRFQRLCRELTDRPRDWADLAVEHGFYDQAHLIHEFNEFSGVAPTEATRRFAACANHLVA